METFIETTGLSGSLLASADYEKNFIVWLLANDQDFIGRGAIGFDLNEMPWSLIDFDKEKSFMLSVASGVKNRVGWEKLLYRPNEEVLFSCIDEFITLLEGFLIDNIDEQHRLAWIGEGNPLYRCGYGAWDNECNTYQWIDGDFTGEIQGYKKCSEHGLYLTYFGCVLCKK
jgi:hypothetical protein